MSSEAPNSEPDVPAYERDPYSSALRVEVRGSGQDGDRPYVVLDDTILFPEGGGQPADRGMLGKIPVVDVQRKDGEIRHYLESPWNPANDSAEATLTLDWERRWDHMQQHSAQHLLTAIAADRFGWPTTAFHLREQVSDIELDVPRLSREQLADLERAVALEITNDLPVTARRVDLQNYEAMAGVRSRGLPAGHQGDVRLVEIAGVDLNTCGGTHVRSTRDLECLKLIGTESLRGGTRLHWVAGERVRRRLGEHEARNAALRRILGSSDAELAETAKQKAADLERLKRKVKTLSKRLAQSEADVLAQRAETVVEAHFDDSEASFLQLIAQRFTASTHSGCALLTATGEKGGFFVIAAGGAGPEDLKAFGGDVAQALGGRGGGSGKIFQGKILSAGDGKGAAIAGRDEALQTLRKHLQAESGT